MASIAVVGATGNTGRATVKELKALGENPLSVVRSADKAKEVLGADALRYFLLREVVFGQDGSFSFDALVQRYNADLANGLGNLASRTLTMISRYFKGEVPYPSHAAKTAAEAEEEPCIRASRSRSVPTSRPSSWPPAARR